MKLGILKEQEDARVALVPGNLKKLKDQGLSIIVEKDAGLSAHQSNDAYAEFAEVADRKQVIESSDILLSIQPPAQKEWSKINKEAFLISEFQPFNDPEIAGLLRQHDLRAFSMDMIPRTTLAQSMDVLSSMASIAGYQSILRAATHLPRFFPMMITAAGSIRPAKVLILGAGVAGLQAIATARRLGAMVEAFDTRSAAKQEVESLGGRFVEVEGAKDEVSAGGYAVQQSEDYLRRQREEVQKRAMKADVIVTTAQVRGRKAPLLVPASTVEQMQPGSVIVDLAASTGGNCELTQDKQTIQHNGITIIGDSALASKMPQDASTLYSNNVTNFISYILKDGAINLDMENEIISGAFITKTQEA